MYTTNVKNIIYVQMCCGGHLEFECIQRYGYANPELLFVVINVMQSAWYFKYHFFRNDIINLSSISIVNKNY